MRRKAWLGLIVVVTTTLLGFPGPAPVSAHAISGAIYTTLPGGATVNGNIYADKDDVYLNGGPTGLPCTSGAVDNGVYVFQVTDPSGSVLLSTDTVAVRTFTVSGGVITSIFPTGTHVTAANTGLCGGIGVQLQPYNNTPNLGGEYKVWITRLTDFTGPSVGNCSLATTGAGCAGVFGFVSGHTKTDNFKVRITQVGPPTTGDLAGLKFYDTNTNGVRDAPADEPGIQNWNIFLFADADSNCATEPAGTDNPIAAVETGALGAYGFTGLNPGRYWVVEESIAGWVHTTDIKGCAEVVAGGTTTVADEGTFVFGNVLLGPGGGRTLGFWSNKNGQALFGSTDLALMVSLNLRDAVGNNFDPANYAAFRTWLLNATAVNMSYMLSAQLAAMELNVFNAFVNGSALIFAGPNPSGCSVPVNGAGFISVNALMSDANTELGADGFTPAGDPNRVCQEFKKDALDAANNNLNFVQPPVTAVTSGDLPALGTVTWAGLTS